MNAIVSGRDKGKRSKSFLLARKMYRQKLRCFRILATRCASCNAWHTSRQTIYRDNIMINLSCIVIACSIILSSVKLEKRFSIAERVSSRLLTSSPYPSPKTIAFIPSGANKQKIKIIDHNKCNVRASKNAEQAFSTQWYLYICYGLLFLFSSVFSNESNS